MSLEGLGYWNRHIGFFFFQQGDLCWCICALRILTERSVWSIVKYSSTKFSIVSVDEMSN
jgi:hypothetical protein